MQSKCTSRHDIRRRKTKIKCDVALLLDLFIVVVYLCLALVELGCKIL